jgi:hypothetical protein
MGISLKLLNDPNTYVLITNRGVLLSTLLHAILHPSHHLLNVLLQIANKLGHSKKKGLITDMTRFTFNKKQNSCRS